jgi:hypothetical protein
MKRPDRRSAPARGGRAGSGSKPSGPRRGSGAERAAPEVIVDFEFDDGLLYVSLQNIGDVPAYDVRAGFDPPFRGLGGEQDASALRMFRHTPFLGPRRTIRSFLDTSAAYFGRGEPRSIAVSITYSGADRRRHRRTIQHDLAVYEDLAFVERRAGIAPGAGSAG